MISITKNILSVLSLLILTSQVAIASVDTDKLKAEIKDCCRVHYKNCKVDILDVKYVQAFTNGTTIYFTKGMLNKITTNEAIAIGFHEVGHIVNNDVQHMKYLQRNNITPKEGIIAYRWTRELKADMFAAEYSYKTYGYNAFPMALLMITNPERITFDSNSHPSTYRRIRLQQQLGRIYETYK